MTLYGGILANVVIYDMESFLEQCVQRYLEVAPKGTKLKEAKTPFLHDEGNHDLSRDPTQCRGLRCALCDYITPEGNECAESKVRGDSAPS